MPSSSINPPLLDPAAVEKLRKVAGDLDPGFVAEMAQLFMLETGKSLIELKAACDRADAPMLMRLAHSLKSSAATLGLMKLARVCLILEMDTKDGETGPATQALVTAVCDQFEEARPVLIQLR